MVSSVFSLQTLIYGVRNASTGRPGGEILINVLTSLEIGSKRTRKKSQRLF